MSGFLADGAYLAETKGNKVQSVILLVLKAHKLTGNLCSAVYHVGGVFGIVFVYRHVVRVSIVPGKRTEG